MSILLSSNSKFHPRPMTPQAMFFSPSFLKSDFSFKTRSIAHDFHSSIELTRQGPRAEPSLTPRSCLFSAELLSANGGRGGSLSSESRAHPFPDFILKSHQSRLNPPPGQRSILSVSGCLSSACPTTVFSHVGSWILNNWAIAFPPRERWIEAGYWTLMFSLWADSLVKQHSFLSAEPLEGRSLSTSRCLQGLCWRPWWLSQGYVTMWLWRR